MNEEYLELLDILKGEHITTVFQPIFDLRTGEVYAHECLTRITGGSRFTGPEALFWDKESNLYPLRYCQYNSKK